MDSPILTSLPVKYIGGLIFAIIAAIGLYLGGVLSVYVIGLVVSWIEAIVG
ncbi:MAG: hypothetical protein MUE51_13650 [Thermoleophilia bacterium]|jgi:hypothetical protein|nr:hypothetical protein [Thermoleophilia bacterium]